MNISEPDKKYLILAEKWLKGTISGEEEQEFATWYNQGQDEPLLIPSSFGPNEEMHRKRLLAYIQKRKENKQRAGVPHLRRVYAIAAACAAILIIGVVWMYSHYTKNTGSNRFGQIFADHQHLVEKRNTSAKVIQIFLPDSSLVQLEGKSTLVYSPAYGQHNRVLSLEGSAVFAVRHNAALPFEVYSDHLITKVLGTKFCISASDNSHKEIVSVLEGRVSVTAQSQGTSLNSNNSTKAIAGYVLNANQEITYDSSSRQILKSLVPYPLLLHPYEKGAFIFTATPLSEVFHRLGKMYGISIIFDRQSLKNCTLTADLSTGSFYDKLEKICLAVNLHYNEIDGHILIDGMGCN